MRVIFFGYILKVKYVGRRFQIDGNVSRIEYEISTKEFAEEIFKNLTDVREWLFYLFK